MTIKKVFNLDDAGTSINIELYDIPHETSKYLFTLQSDDYGLGPVSIVLNKQQMQGLLKALADSME